MVFLGFRREQYLYVSKYGAIDCEPGWCYMVSHSFEDRVATMNVNVYTVIDYHYSHTQSVLYS